MAWEYVDLPETGTYGYSSILDWSVGLTLDPITSTYVSGYDLTLGEGMLNAESDAKSNTTSYGLAVYWYSRNSKITGYDVYANGTRVAGLSTGMDKATMRFAINRETQDAKVVSMSIYRNTMYGNRSTSIYNYSVNDYASRKVLYDLIMGLLPVESTSSNGGGATHISRTTGLLKSLSSNLTSLLIASGAGGGGLLVNNTEYAGADAGGMEGNGTNSANQNSGNAFGQGGDGELASGGGSGLYGGYAGDKSVIPQYLQNYVDKIASFTATAYSGQTAVMLYYSYGSTHFVLSRKYSAALISGSFNSIRRTTSIEFMLLEIGRLNVTYNKVSGETTLSFTGFANPSPMPITYQGTGYNASSSIEYSSAEISLAGGPDIYSFNAERFTTTFSNIIECLTYCADHFRNVELYVNGEEWIGSDSTKSAYEVLPISGGAGSGYIGNSVLSNKKMVGYNVTTSSAVDTKTETTDIFSAIAQPNIPKKNDGWVRIAFLRTLSPDDYSYLQHINELYMKVNENWLKFTSVPANNGSVSPDSGGTFDDRTYICDDFTNFRYTSQGSLHGPAVLALNGIMTIRVTVHPYSTTVTYDDLHYIDINTVWSGADWQSLVINGLSLNYVEAGRLSSYYVGQTPPEQYQSYLQASFNTLTEAIEYIYQHYAVINLYVNNSLWVSVDN